ASTERPSRGSVALWLPPSGPSLGGRQLPTRSLTAGNIGSGLGGCTTRLGTCTASGRQGQCDLDQRGPRDSPHHRTKTTPTNLVSPTPSNISHPGNARLCSWSTPGATPTGKWPSYLVLRHRRSRSTWSGVSPSCGSRWV